MKTTPLKKCLTYWRKHRIWLLPCLLISIIGGTLWSIKTYQYKQTRRHASIRYQTLTHTKDQHQKEQMAQAIMQDYPDTVYADLAAFQLAQYAVHQKKYRKAQQALTAVIQHTTFPIFKQLATLRYARIFVEQHDLKQARAYLQTLDNQTLAPLSNLIRADLEHAEKQYQKAHYFYDIAQKNLPDNHPLTHLIWLKQGLQ